MLPKLFKFTLKVSGRFAKCIDFMHFTVHINRYSLDRLRTYSLKYARKLKRQRNVLTEYNLYKRRNVQE